MTFEPGLAWCSAWSVSPIIGSRARGPIDHDGWPGGRHPASDRLETSVVDRYTREGQTFQKVADESQQHWGADGYKNPYLALPRVVPGAHI